MQKLNFYLQFILKTQIFKIFHIIILYDNRVLVQQLNSLKLANPKLILKKI